MDEHGLARIIARFHHRKAVAIRLPRGHIGRHAGVAAGVAAGRKTAMRRHHGRWFSFGITPGAASNVACLGLVGSPPVGHMSDRVAISPTGCAPACSAPRAMRPVRQRRSRTTPVWQFVSTTTRTTRTTRTKMARHHQRSRRPPVELAGINRSNQLGAACFRCCDGRNRRGAVSGVPPTCKVKSQAGGWSLCESMCHVGCCWCGCLLLLVAGVGAAGAAGAVGAVGDAGDAAAAGCWCVCVKHQKADMTPICVPETRGSRNRCSNGG